MNLRGIITIALVLSCSPALAQTNPGTSPLSILKGGTGGISAAAARINLGFAATANRLYGTDGSGVSTVVTLPAAGLTLSGGAISLANDLAALEGLSSTGICRRTGTDTWSVGTAVSNAEHATMAAFTFKGNNTSGSATPTDVDIAALTTKASPAAGDYVIISDQAALGAWKKAAVSSVGAAGSVGSIAGNTGAFTLGGGITNNVNQIRRSYTESVLNTTPANATSITSTSGIMAGFGANCAITPATSTRIRVTFDGIVGNNTQGNGTTITVRYGTGSAPPFNSALSGTLIGASPVYGNGVSPSNVPFSLTRIITGLTAGVAYWLDMGVTVSANTAALTSITCTAEEI